ncbi:SAM-dependent methyltransferase [Anabaena azotica FACHB-119]|uniref:SAM-dependent methyltransferase n=2 Tax=Anabaena azotica TaxID=197653 RepID=A0ABR8D576_9NOST|nr:SAM-dependent methyltransferase [Anabaena azotica FACHB-119]
MWDILGQPVPFYLVEMGAGQGLLALHILKYIQAQYPQLFAALQYLIVEKSPGLKQEQQQRLQEFPVRWCNWEEIESNSIIGCFFSNELVDAFPVHQFMIEAGELREIYVTLRGDEGVGGDGGDEGDEGDEGAEEQRSNPPLTPPRRGKEQRSRGAEEQRSRGRNTYFPVPSPQSPDELTEITAAPSTPKLAEYFDLVGINLAQGGYEDGYRSEINLAALDWLSIVADRLQRGYVITIDYGYPASRYYNPRRSQGTLQCYYQHRHHDNPYINIGQQDITAHVDFTALEKWGDRCGLAKLGFTQQALFLMALGLGLRIAALSHQQISVPELLNRRQALHQLIDPTGLGGFGVLIQSKGLTKQQASQPLKGLTVPGG